MLPAASPHTTASLLLDPAAPIRRPALMLILLVSVLTGVLTLSFAVTSSWSAFDTQGLALLCVWYLLLLLILAWRPQALRAVGIAYFAVGAVTALLKFSVSVLLQPVPYFGPYAYWAPLSYLVAVLVLPPRVAWLAALGLYAGYLTIGAVFALHPQISVAVKQGAVSGFLQLYLSHALYLSVYLLLARLIREYLASVLRAEAEARGAYEDALTGLPNRRQLNAWLDAELLRAQVYDEPFSLVVFDLDHFKRVNDTHGHAAGDAVLRDMATAVQQALRGDTRFGRWGGEEFVLLLPRTALPGAQRVAERVSEVVRDLYHPGVGHVTASFGVAQYVAGENAAALFGRADAALYQAKRAGRARVQA